MPSHPITLQADTIGSLINVFRQPIEFEFWSVLLMVGAAILLGHLITDIRSTNRDIERLQQIKQSMKMVIVLDTMVDAGRMVAEENGFAEEFEETVQEASEAKQDELERVERTIEENCDKPPVEIETLVEEEKRKTPREFR